MQSRLSHRNPFIISMYHCMLVQPGHHSGKSNEQWNQKSDCMACQTKGDSLLSGCKRNPPAVTTSLSSSFAIVHTSDVHVPRNYLHDIQTTSHPWPQPPHPIHLLLQRWLVHGSQSLLDHVGGIGGECLGICPFLLPIEFDERKHPSTSKLVFLA